MIQKSLNVIVFILFLYFLNIYFLHVSENINLLNNKGYIRENIYFIMNLKDRGITVGDLLIILIVIITSTILIKSFSKDKKTRLHFINYEKVTYNNIHNQNLFEQLI